jgi:hypothetical protein
MKPLLVILFLLTANVLGADYYLWKDGANVSPYSSKADAATNFHDAVDLMSSGDTLYMYEGDYWLTKSYVNQMNEYTSYIGMEPDIEKVTINFGTNSLRNFNINHTKWANITFQNLNVIRPGADQQTTFYFNSDGLILTNLLFKNNYFNASNNAQNIFFSIRPRTDNVIPLYVDNIRFVSNSLVDGGSSCYFVSFGYNIGGTVKNILFQNNIQSNFYTTGDAEVFVQFAAANDQTYDNIQFLNNNYYSGTAFSRMITQAGFNHYGITFKNFIYKNNNMLSGAANSGLIKGFGSINNSTFENFIIEQNSIQINPYTHIVDLSGVTSTNNTVNRFYVHNNSYQYSTRNMVEINFRNSTYKNMTIIAPYFTGWNGSSIVLGGPYDGGNTYKNIIAYSANSQTLLGAPSNGTNTYGFFSALSSDSLSISDPATVITSGDFSSVFKDFSIDNFIDVYRNLLADDNDYTIKSEAGGWDEQLGTWVYSDSTSPTVDGGDPTDDASSEPYYNGGIINMGYYGGTPKAAKSLGATFHGITKLTNQPAIYIIPSIKRR